jgi:RNA polymerase sigma-70 factor, ECF subfamily
MPSRSTGWRGKLTGEQKLWKRISEGDATAFDAFYRENAPCLVRFFRHIVSSLSAAEDLTQETFVQIWKRPQRFDPEQGSLRAYLFGVARKQAAEWWRRQKPVDELGEIEEKSSSLESASILSDAFGRLPEEQRMLLWLREVEGQSYAELAVIFDIPLGTVRSRLFAAREALREIWHGAQQKEGATHEVR